MAGAEDTADDEVTVTEVYLSFSSRLSSFISISFMFYRPWRLTQFKKRACGRVVKATDL